MGVTYRSNAEGAERVVAGDPRPGPRGGAVELDLAEPRAATAAIDALAERLGGVDVLVNNAGVNRRATVLEETIEGFDRTLAVNLVGPWACAQAAARHMIAAAAAGRSSTSPPSWPSSRSTAAGRTARRRPGSSC